MPKSRKRRKPRRPQKDHNPAGTKMQKAATAHKIGLNKEPSIVHSFYIKKQKNAHSNSKNVEQVKEKTTVY